MFPASSNSNATLKGLLDRSDVQRLLAALNSGGHEARIVGGAVRDAIMNRSVDDIDVATTAAPDVVIDRASRHGWKAIPTGIEHGTVTIVIGGTPYEVTTLRRDVETNGRRAVVAFTRDFRTDAFRRDFTINAMSLSADGQIHDYATGLSDARNGTVRFIGEAEQRIREDYLRILRFFRFFASHGKGEPDSEGLKACCERAAGMASLSRERVRQELLKLLSAPRAIEAATAMDRIGLWSYVVPGKKPALADLEALIRLEMDLGLSADSILRLASLASGVPSLQESLKLSNQEADRIKRAEQFASEIDVETTTAAEAKSLVFRAGGDGFHDAVLLASARIALEPDRVRKALAEGKPFTERPPVNPFRSADLTTRGIAAGPRMGAILKTALDLWLEHGLPDDPEAQMLILEKAIQKHPD